MAVLDRLSPSKIGSFRRCPAAFAFRYVDGLEEPSDRYMVRGTLVHEVCERLFDFSPADRTISTATQLLHRLWERMVDGEQELRDLFTSAEDVTRWLQSAEALLATWFALESPAAITVAGRELFVEAEGPDGTVLAGIVDRLDRLDDGTYAVTDYKTGPAPTPGWERRDFFQLRFYALLCHRSLGLRISVLRLVHLGNGGEVLELPFSADDEGGVDRQIAALTAAMAGAWDRGRWVTNVSRACDWCAFRARCPAWQVVS